MDTLNNGTRDSISDLDRGLDSAGFIRPEASLERVTPAYLPVVADLRDRCRAAFGADLHGLYLNGSVVKGTATPGVSDLDALALLCVAPNADHEALARVVADAIETRHPLLVGASVGLLHHEVILSQAQRYDMGFFIKCLCAHVDGVDLTAMLPRYRPSVALARGTNGNIRRLVDDRRARVAGCQDSAEVAFLCRGIMRKIVRTGFTLVMPRYRGWTSDLEPCATIFAAYYPAWADAMQVAADLARHPSGDRHRVLAILDTLGAWLADEYDRVIMVRG